MDTKHIHCMLEKIAEYGKCMMEDAVGAGNVNLEDASKIVDMVKDLACAEKDALIAKEMRKEAKEDEAEEKYFLKMLKDEYKDEYKRMKEEYGDDEGERRFYDNYRYANGRFAPKGRGSYEPRRSGRRRGYEEPPYYHVMPDMYDDYNAEQMRDLDRKSMNRMYYTPMAGSGNTGNTDGKTYSDGVNEGTRRGYSEGYEKGMSDGRRSSENSRYEKAKRGYEETKEMHKGNTPEDKQMTMKEAEKFVNVILDELEDALEDASPEVKNMVKSKTVGKMQKM